MAKRKRPRRVTPPKLQGNGTARMAVETAPPTGPAPGMRPGVETTGRFMIVFKRGAADSATVRTTLRTVAGLTSFASSEDYREGAIAAADLAGPAAHFSRLGVAVVEGGEAMMALSASASAADSPILAIEPEYVAYPTSTIPQAVVLDYLRGYRDAVNQLVDRLTPSTAPAVAGLEALAAFQDTSQFTWGLQATKVSTTSQSGSGVKVAILDTGFNLTHPDFVGRPIVSESFSGLPVEDIAGHGTHCAGTACGPNPPASGVRRYGIAFGAQMFVGKVFNNAVPRPGAKTSDVIAGIEWAVAQGCQVVSMSLGIPMNAKVAQYEVPIQRALDLGTLVVCAAGNNANRPGLPGFNPDEPATAGFVEPPANSDAAVAVAALDSQLRIAVFSARSSLLTGDGGKVNIAAPGVSVFSSFPVIKGTHGSISGTSMATPHVAGIAALWSQATGESGPALWNRLMQSAKPLSLDSADVGAGLAQAPQ